MRDPGKPQISQVPALAVAHSPTAIPAENQASPVEMFLRSRFDRHPTEIARLHKMRLTVAQETPKARSRDEAKINGVPFCQITEPN
jgi:hypothetical protein